MPSEAVPHGHPRGTPMDRVDAFAQRAALLVAEPGRAAPQAGFGREDFTGRAAKSV